MELKSFTSLDFETANYKRSSACSIGLVKVEDGIIVKEKSFLIKPQPNYFIPQFIGIHNITPDMIEDAPFFGEIWSDIRDMIEETDAILAHNAAFDISVLRACINMEMIRTNIPPHICTVKMARQKLPFLHNHKLNTVCEYFDIELDHHEALSDARGCAKIALEMSKL